MESGSLIFVGATCQPSWWYDMGLLDGDMKAIFGTAFGSFYLSGTLVRVTLTDDGEGGYSEATTSVAVKVQVDQADERLRQAEGYSDGDVRLIILQSGIGTVPTTDDRVTIGGETWGVYAITADPANTYWEMGARRYGA